MQAKAAKIKSKNLEQLQNNRHKYDNKLETHYHKI